MDILKECAQEFRKLFHTDFIIVAGHKQKRLEIKIAFHDEQFHHIIGLHKLIDLPQISKPKNKKILFHNIMSNNITYGQIQQSSYIEEVNQRANCFHLIEQLLNSNIILRFDNKKAHTKLNAEILLYKNHEQKFIHLFFKSMTDKVFIPCSFFLRDDSKYIIRQEVYKVLSVEKIKR